MEISWNPEAHLLRVKGSLPYWIQGHNFTFSKVDFIEGVEVLQGLLGVGLWDAELDAFEFGCIFPVEGKPADYILNHYAPKHSHLCLNEKGKDKGAFRWWEDASKSLKLYDAGKNVKMKQGLLARQVIQEEGFNPVQNYLKFELHHKKPHLLNNGKILLLESLQNPSFQQFLSSTLIEYYHQLQPMRTLIKPADKKDLKALDIAVLVLVEHLMNQGIPIDQAKKQVYAYINQAGCLDKQDKDARKATFRKVFDKLQESEESQWDLTHKIEEALAVED